MGQTERQPVATMAPQESRLLPGKEPVFKMWRLLLSSSLLLLPVVVVVVMAIVVMATSDADSC